MIDPCFKTSYKFFIENVWNSKHVKRHIEIHISHQKFNIRLTNYLVLFGCCKSATVVQSLFFWTAASTIRARHNRTTQQEISSILFQNDSWFFTVTTVHSADYGNDKSRSWCALNGCMLFCKIISHVLPFKNVTI